MQTFIETQAPKKSSPALKGSIVVIVKNGESGIRACLESLMRQTVQCEVIVVDGNSTDRTREIVQQFPVKLVLAPERDSYGVSRNVGVQESIGDVVMFMDADDYCENDWSGSLLRCFDWNSQVGIATVARETSNLEGWFMAELGFEYRKEKEGTWENRSRSTDWKDVTTKGSAWLKRAIVEAGGFDEAMFFGTEDKDLAYRISKLSYTIVHDPSIRITVSPVGGALNFLKDKYWRAGVGHGYFRRKHGIYRPSLSGLGSLALCLLGIGLLLWQPWLALSAFVLAAATLVSLAKEGLRLRSRGAPLAPTIGFLFIKWLSRIAEFFGFLKGYFFIKK
jgi:glycosyltransferase involved in cell wall biosynthesis